jgi:L-ascorbate metabolism protein UlaG (beta-lactamase superfamily)
MAFKYIWYGHGTHGIETGGHRVVVDPFFTDNPSASIPSAELDVDYVVVSHGHGDHIGDAISIAKRTGAQVISNFEIINWLGSQDLENLHPQHIGGGFHHPFGYLKLTHALHGSGLPDGAYGGNPAGILLKTLGGEVIYLACDTGLFASMKLIGEEGIDLAVLPIGDNFTMGPDDALRALKMLQPKHVIPVHYNTWPVIEQDPLAWAVRVEAETDAIPHVLQPGDHFSLS